MQNFIENALASGKRKYLDETFKYLEEISRENSFVCYSHSPHINNVEFSLLKTNRAFKYTTRVNLVKGDMLFNKNAYGVMEKFILTNKEYKIEVPHADTVCMNIERDSDGLLIDGEIAELQSDLVKHSPKYFRLLLPKEDAIHKNHKAYIESEKFLVNESIHLLGLMEFKCAGSLFHVFDYSKNDNSHYLIIDCLEPKLYSDFETAASAILHSIGFIIAYVPRNESKIFQAEDPDFKNITGFSFKKTGDTLSSAMEVISPHLLSDALKLNTVKGHLTLDIISNMATKAYEDKRLLRALKIICEGNIYPMEIRASTYSVALETIKNIVNEEHADKINPFKVKAFSQITIKTLIAIIDQISADHFNSKEAIKKKLEQLNQVTNKDSFKIAFKMCGFELSPEDEAVLLLRNDFLHGRLPFENEDDFKHHQELRYTTYKLHFLVAILILKYCGFSGVIINSPKLFSVLAPDGKEIKEPLFCKI